MAVDRLAAHRNQHDQMDGRWPVALGVNDRGQSIYVCAACEGEIPDGAVVYAARDKNGLVVGTRAMSGETVLHDCAGEKMPRRPEFGTVEWTEFHERHGV